MGRVSLGGVKDLFQTPPAKSPISRLETPSSVGTPDSVLYADIPDTPVGPGEMFVSPLSSQKGSAKKSRKSAVLVGVKELFKSRVSKSPASPSGIKRLMKSPLKQTMPASPTGVAQLFTEPVLFPSLVFLVLVKLLFNVHNSYLKFFSWRVFL